MYNNKKVYILGMARSGYEAAKLLAKRKNEVIITDLKEQNIEHVDELISLGVNVCIGYVPDIDESFDYLIKNPGIKDSHEIVQKAYKLGIPVLNEVELGFELLPKNVKVIGITGSNGKTTTTTLVYEILKKANKSVVLAGNIGYPLCSFVDNIKKNDILLMEISIQQLCNFNKFKTNISVLTNIYDAHLDFVGSKGNYINIKKRIFSHHTSDDVAILNYDNLEVLDNTNDINSTKKYFSKLNKDFKCYISDNSIYYDSKEFIKIEEIKLKGSHNYENVLAAILVAKELEVSDEDIKYVLRKFNGVEHRIEFVKEIDGVSFYNDSKSTNVKATQIALSSFNKPVILLLGGLDRHHSFDDLKEYMKNVKLVISYGETKDRIKLFCDENNIKCHVKNTLYDATNDAFMYMTKGDVVLLSPACASWDQFDDFEQRGTMFKEYVNNR